MPPSDDRELVSPSDDREPVSPSDDREPVPHSDDREPASPPTDVAIETADRDAAHTDTCPPDAPDTGTCPPDAATLDSRLQAVERALTDGEIPVADLADAETLARRVARLEDVVDDLEERVVELETASRALRGYAGGIRAVNEDVERRADLALAKVESIERSLREEPGLRVERLDPDIAADVDDEAAPADFTGDSSDGDGGESGFSDSDADSGPLTATGPAGDDSGASTADEYPSETDRSLAERIRDAL